MDEGILRSNRTQAGPRIVLVIDVVGRKNPTQKKCREEENEEVRADEEEREPMFPEVPLDRGQQVDNSST